MDAAAPRRDDARPAMTAFALAWRTARRYRARAVLAIVGVAVIGALNFDMLLLSHGLLLSFADLINRTGYDIRIVGSAGLPLARLPVDQASTLMAEIGGLPEVVGAALVRTEEAETTLTNQPTLPLEVVGTTDPAGAGTWTLVSGRDLADRIDTPSSPTPPIVVARSLASRLGLKPGSTLRLRVRNAGTLSALPPVNFRVAGIADFPFEATGAYMVATTIAGFQMAHGGGARDQADMVLAASAPTSGPDAAVAAIARLRPDLRVLSNDQVIASFNRNGFAYFRQISIVLSSMTAAFTFLLVATLLTVSVNQRLGEVAALRALGIARRKIAVTLLWEAALLVGVGGVLAVPLGELLAVGLDRILRRMPGLPDGLHFFVFEPRALVLHAALLAATAVVAALYPMWLAVNLPIAQTLRQEIVS
jgi:putative ABC transport system permease protein